MGWLWLTGVVLLIADRWVKAIVMQGYTLNLGPLQIALVQNDALVFSWPAPNWLAASVMVLAMGVMLLLVRRWWVSGQRAAVIGLLYVLVGAASNLYDRLFHGYVIDWLSLGRWWPVMNLADLTILLGVVVAWRRWRGH